MASRKEAQAAPETVTITKAAAKHLLEMVEGMASVDRAYKPCDSTIFRSWCQGAYRAPGVQDAVSQLKEALENV